jgi:hypothetical protein
MKRRTLVAPTVKTATVDMSEVTEQERAFSERYPRLYAAIMALGRTNDERARALGMKRRAFHDVKQGIVSLKASRLENNPALARAWYEDVVARTHTDCAA